MKILHIKYSSAFAIVLATLLSCGSDDDATPEPAEEISFSGTFVQKDQMGRPGINTVLSGTENIKNDLNLTIPSLQGAKFQPLFLTQLTALHDAFGAEYETNILNLDATVLTTILASDVLQVATDVPTTYYDGTNVLTGRNLKDDVIDVSLILLFGGTKGNRFNGQDTDSDGVADLPILVTDNVSNAGETPSDKFPYLENPHSL